MVQKGKMNSRLLLRGGFFGVSKSKVHHFIADFLKNGLNLNPNIELIEVNTCEAVFFQKQAFVNCII